MKTNQTAAVCIFLLAIFACSPFTLTTPTAAPAENPSASALTTPPTPLPTLKKISPTANEGSPLEENTPTPGEKATPWALTAWPSLAPQPAAPARLTPGIHIQLDEIHMVSRMEGWGIRGTYVLTTSDGGQTWREVTPSVGQVDKIYGAFLNAKDAWIMFSYGGHVSQTFTVYFTTDGGRTWTYNQGPPINPQAVGDSTWPEFAALDAQNVWIMVRGVYVGAGTHYNHELFRTADGGTNWISLDGETSNDYTGMVFADRNSGLRTLQTLGAYAAAPPAYDITADGGSHWENRELPPPSDSIDLFTQYPYCETYQPVMQSARSIRLLVGCFDYNYPPKQFVSYFYSSQDGGAAWTSVRLPDKVLASQDSLFYYGSNNALVLGRDSYLSTDAGGTWSHLATVFWDGQYSFVDPEDGWAVASANGKISLVRTTDGGADWSEVEPAVAR